MRIAAPLPRSRARAIASALLFACTSAAYAAPDDALDAVTKLLADKVLPAAAPASTPATIDPSISGETASPATTATAPALLRQVRDRATEAVVSAMNFIGVPYRRGGSSVETGFDCSGFTRYVFENSLGLVLPRQADQQAKAAGLIAVKREDLQPGDLVFFNTMKRTFSHVGIYIGDNRFIHAPSRGKDVRTDDLGFAYWAKRFTGARRAELPSEPVAALGQRAEPQTQ